MRTIFPAIMVINRLIFVSLLIMANSESTFKIIDNQAPMIISHLAKAHVSYDSFKIVFYVDLEQYYHLTVTLSTCLDVLRNLSINGETSLSTPITQLERRFDSLKHDEEFIGVFRQKRYILCEFCGDVQHFLYGTMSSSQAQEWADVVNGIRNQTIKNHDLIKNQTTLVEAELKYNQKTFHRIETVLNELNNKIVKATNWTSENIKIMKQEIRTTNLIQITHLAFDEHARLYDQIRRALNDARMGKIPELISKQLVKSEMKLIAENLQSTQRLPIDFNSDNILKVFKFSMIFSSLYDNKLMMEVNIPITEREEYNLYKATPIPIPT